MNQKLMQIETQGGGGATYSEWCLRVGFKSYSILSLCRLIKGEWRTFVTCQIVQQFESSFFGNNIAIFRRVLLNNYAY